MGIDGDHAVEDIFNDGIDPSFRAIQLVELPPNEDAAASDGAASETSEPAAESSSDAGDSSTGASSEEPGSETPVEAKADDSNAKAGLPTDTAADAPTSPPAPVASQPPVAKDAAAGKTGAQGVSPILSDTRDVDYYDKRAAEILKEDSNARIVTDHPLIKAHPDKFVVVCEAGCRNNGGPAIVSIRSMAKAAAETNDTNDKIGTISCVGGCRNGPTIAATGFDGAPAMAAVAGEWLTAKSPDAAKTSTDKAVASSGNGSGDWMARINTERSSVAEAAPEKPAVAAEPAKTAAAMKSAEAPTAKAPEAPAAPVASAPATAEKVAEEASKTFTKVLNGGANKPAPVAAEAATDTMKTAETAPAATAPEAKPTEAAEAKPTEAVEVKPAEAAAAKPAEAVEAKPADVAEATPAPVAMAKPVETKVADLGSSNDAAKPTVQPGDKVVSVASEDAEVNAAMAKARSSLPEFWTSFEKPGTGEGDFALKVAVTDAGKVEHFWLTKITRNGGELSGVISNEPQMVRSVKIGETYKFAADKISDWTFKRNGKLVGNETMRALLGRMPAEQATAYRSMYETP